MKKIILVTLILTTSVMLISCGKVTLKDGTFKGVVSAEEIESKNTGDSDVTIEVKDGKIISCKFITRDGNGHPKDENYGKSAGEKNFVKAQKSVQAIKMYEDELVKKQDIDEVESISGATINHSIFVKAFKYAIKQMK